MLLEELMDSDRWLVGAIRRRLSVVTVIQADDVTVAVNHGHVVLSGTVESFSERAMCAEVAQSLAGDDVENELDVRPVDICCGASAH